VAAARQFNPAMNRPTARAASRRPGPSEETASCFIVDLKAFMSDIEYLSQASMICLLLFILSTTTIIEYPERFQ